MIVWVDAQLAPALAPWLTKELGVEAYSVRYLNLLRAKDRGIFDDTLPDALKMIEAGEILIEITDLA